MTTDQSGPSPRIRINKRRTRDEDVGYGKPPRAHQFRAGQSGNPRGRPKGAKNEATLLLELLDRTKLALREGGRLRKVTVREGILRRIIEDALRGNTKSASFILNRFCAMVSGETPQADFSDEDREILAAYLRDHAGKVMGS